jgi:NADPH:quinone reductase-like Zn-dependent oxidoreductase
MSPRRLGGQWDSIQIRSVLHEKSRAEWTEVPVPTIGPSDALTPNGGRHLHDGRSHDRDGGASGDRGKGGGHEAVGVVEQVGELVKDFKPGDRVVIPTGYPDWRHPRSAARRTTATRIQGDRAALRDIRKGMEGLADIDLD